MNNDERCGTCRFFHRDNANVRQGFCRVRAPAVFPVAAQGPIGATLQFASSFPPTQEVHWCGEWNARLH
jgi:hypothetical protein